MEDKQIYPLVKMLSYFWGPISWMIEAAVILSAFLGDWRTFPVMKSKRNPFNAHHERYETWAMCLMKGEKILIAMPVDPCSLSEMDWN